MENLIPEIKRKSFHLLGLGYVVVLVLVGRPVFLVAVAVGLLAVTLGEVLRLRWAPLRGWVHHTFGGLFREHERNHFSGLFWMLLGVFSSAAILRSVSLISATILYVVFGDMAASFGGKMLGGPAWPARPKKHISGSVACFLACVLVGIFLVNPVVGWVGVVAGAAAAALAETYVPLDDNFALPFFSALALALCSLRG